MLSQKVTSRLGQRLFTLFPGTYKKTRRGWAFPPRYFSSLPHPTPFGDGLGLGPEGPITWPQLGGHLEPLPLPGSRRGGSGRPFPLSGHRTPGGSKPQALCSVFPGGACPFPPWSQRQGDWFSGFQPPPSKIVSPGLPQAGRGGALGPAWAQWRSPEVQAGAPSTPLRPISTAPAPSATILTTYRPHNTKSPSPGTPRQAGGVGGTAYGQRPPPTLALGGRQDRKQSALL